jgi:hypothetical protein
LDIPKEETKIMLELSVTLFFFPPFPLKMHHNGIRKKRVLPNCMKLDVASTQVQFIEMYSGEKTPNLENQTAPLTKWYIMLAASAMSSSINN